MTTLTILHGVLTITTDYLGREMPARQDTAYIVKQFVSVAVVLYACIAFRRGIVDAVPLDIRESWDADFCPLPRSTSEGMFSAFTHRSSNIVSPALARCCKRGRARRWRLGLPR